MSTSAKQQSYLLSLFLLPFILLILTSFFAYAYDYACDENNFCSRSQYYHNSSDCYCIWYNSTFVEKGGRYWKVADPDNCGKWSSTCNKGSRNIGNSYFGTIVINPLNGYANNAILGGEMQIIEILDDNRHPKKMYKGAMEVERLAKNSCSHCVTVITFRNGCAAVAWSPKEKRYYHSLEEYRRNWKRIQTTGENPQLTEVEQKALKKCPLKDCQIVSSLCTPD